MSDFNVWFVVLVGSATVVLYVFNLILKRVVEDKEKRHEIVGLTACGLFIIWLLSVFVSR